MAMEVKTVTMIGLDGGKAIVNECDVADFRGQGYRLEGEPAPTKKGDGAGTKGKDGKKGDGAE